ncbi:hypothetical protein [Vibrio gallaecicus]|nr:hypothetical protein [Vibrio gallaecicus]MDN3617191.1 hypothetical protein [Vibrio gallaecicus]
MAFSTRFSFSDFGAKFECIGSVVSYLIGRYKAYLNLGGLVC